MRKNVFLEELQEALTEGGIQRDALQEILDDYQAIIEDAIEAGEDEGDFIEKLGSLKSIVSSLRRHVPKSTPKHERFIAVSPFVALLIFFILGFTQNLWHPAWLAFLLIPMTAIFLETRSFERLVALSPFVITFIFILLGTYQNLWHPLWALYILIVGFGLMTSSVRWIRLSSVYPFLSVGLYIGLSLLRPELAFWGIALFLPIIPIAIVSGVLQISFAGVMFKSPNGQVNWRELLMVFGLVLGLSLVYVYIGLTWDIWHPTWLLYLSIPLGGLAYARWVKKHVVPWVTFMPFVSLLIFFLWGHYYGAYGISWLAFLLIPMVAILTDQNES